MKGGSTTGQILQILLGLVLTKNTDWYHFLHSWYLGPYKPLLPWILWTDIFTSFAWLGWRTVPRSLSHTQALHLCALLPPCVASQGSSPRLPEQHKPQGTHLCGIAVSWESSWSELPQRAAVQKNPQQFVTSSQLPHSVFLTRLNLSSCRGTGNKLHLSFLLRTCLIRSFSLCSKSLPKGKPLNSWLTLCCSQSWFRSLFSSG